jgi:hypothetical protein
MIVKQYILELKSKRWTQKKTEIKSKRVKPKTIFQLKKDKNKAQSYLKIPTQSPMP